MKPSSKISFLFIATIFCSILTSSHLNAQSCHEGSGGRTPVLSSSQRTVLSLASSYRTIQGQFNPYGKYRQNPEGASLNTSSTTPGIALRFAEEWQGGLSLPLLYKQQNLSGKKENIFSTGDPVAEVRYTLWDDVAFLPYRPELQFYGGGSFPLAKEGLGEGTHLFHFGATTFKTYWPFKLTFDSSFFYLLKKENIKNGNRIQVLEGISYLMSHQWNAFLNFKHLWILKTVFNNKIIEGSAGRLFSTLAGVTYSYNPSLSLALSYETPFPFYRYIVNHPHSHQISVGWVYNL